LDPTTSPVRDALVAKRPMVRHAVTAPCGVLDQTASNAWDAMAAKRPMVRLAKMILLLRVIHRHLLLLIIRLKHPLANSPMAIFVEVGMVAQTPMVKLVVESAKAWTASLVGVAPVAKTLVDEFAERANTWIASRVVAVMVAKTMLVELVAVAPCKEDVRESFFNLNRVIRRRSAE
jgi:hypothetical protein